MSNTNIPGVQLVKISHAEFTRKPSACIQTVNRGLQNVMGGDLWSTYRVNDTGALLVENCGNGYGEWFAVMLGDVPVLSSAHPKPAVEPMTDERISAALRDAIEIATVYEAAAFKKGVRFAEKFHGIGVPKEGGAP